jgi:hypothetical protein
LHALPHAASQRIAAGAQISQRERNVHHVSRIHRTGAEPSAKQSRARASSMRIRLSSSGRPAALRESWLAPRL